MSLASLLVLTLGRVGGLQPVAPLDTLTSGLASIARLPYGTEVASELRTKPASAPTAITLYDREGCAACRRVREMITYLDLAVHITPSGEGSRYRDEVARVAEGLSQEALCPFLLDEATGVRLTESHDICEYLLTTYGEPSGVSDLPAPPEYFYPSTGLTGWLPALFRPGRGVTVDPQVNARPTPAAPLVLYSYEGNQFCRLVREALTELDLAYDLRSTGKGSPRRAELADARGDGKTTAPFLLDANTDVAMGESADIVAYLQETYGGVGRS